jgi:hypothetical protein
MKPAFFKSQTLIDVEVVILARAFWIHTSPSFHLTDTLQQVAEFTS